jgi:hypothetical protein
MVLTLVPLVIGAAIILAAVRSYQKHRQTEARVCGDVRRMLAGIAPLAAPVVFETLATPPVVERAARN